MRLKDRVVIVTGGARGIAARMASGWRRRARVSSSPTSPIPSRR